METAASAQRKGSQFCFISLLAKPLMCLAFNTEKRHPTEMHKT